MISSRRGVGLVSGLSVVSGLQVELLQLAGGTSFCGVWAVLEVLGICDGCTTSDGTARLGGVVVSVALVEVSLARTGAVGSARTIGVRLTLSPSSRLAVVNPDGFHLYLHQLK